jgi:hypothetical protein
METSVNQRYGIILLVLAAIIAFGTALAHFSCIFFGIECYSAQMAPQSIILSSQNGTFLAPAATVVASIIFAALGFYALSGAGLIRKLPFLTFGIYSISVVCVVRGLLPLQLWVRHPEKVNNAALLVGLLWLFTGLIYWIGYKNICKSKV